MARSYSTQLAITFVAITTLLLGACRAEMPSRYVAAKKTGADAETAGKKTPPKTSEVDTGEDNNVGETDDGKGKELDPPKTGEVLIPSKEEPKPKEPEVDPEVERKAKLLEACTPKSFTIKDETNGTEGFALFTGVFKDASKELNDIAINDCVSMYKTADEVKAVKRNNLTIVITVDNHNGVAYANPVNNTQISNVHISTGHIRNYKNASAADRKTEFYGVMSHEINHLFQNFGSNTTPYTEGLCDAIRADADYYPRSRKNKIARSTQNPTPWRGSYTDTGYFVRYLKNKKDPDFYWKFNKAMPTWNENFWQNTFGKSAADLWDEYQRDGFNEY